MSNRDSRLPVFMRPRGLIAALAAGLAISTVAQAATRDAAPPVPLARQLLSELIAINSTHAHGTTVAAAALAKHFRDAGFAATDVIELAPSDHPEMGNLVVRLRGSGSAKPVLYIGHLDVVEAKPEDWTVDPFTLTEKDGWLYGRGTIDMKGQVAAVAANLIAMKKAGIVPKRDIVVAFTADEEAGAVANGVEFLLREHRPLIDAEFAVNPDGGEAGLKNGERRYVGLQTGEKVFHTLTLTLTDKGGHSSRPTAANPIVRMARDLAKVADYTVLIVMNTAGRVVYVDRFHKLDWNLQVARIKAALERFNNASVLVDSSGAGEPIYESLATEGVAVTPYPFTAKSKTALIDNLSLRLERRELTLPKYELCPVVVDELEAFEYSVTDLGHVRTGAPSGMHDDVVIALALAAWHSKVGEGWVDW